MPRPLRQEDAPGAIHHVFVRGVERSAVAVDAIDYKRALGLLEQTVERFELICHAWCFLPNHFHLLLTSRLGNLSAAMQWHGTCAAMAFNQRHDRAGHLYQGRFGSRLVADDGYFLELTRYLPLNPVRAGLCGSASQWPWSSYRATAGSEPTPAFLDVREILERFDSRAQYAAWVADGVEDCPLDELGARRRPALGVLLADGTSVSAGRAHEVHGYRKADIARHLGLSRGQLNRWLAEARS